VTQEEHLSPVGAVLLASRTATLDAMLSADGLAPHGRSPAWQFRPPAPSSASRRRLCIGQPKFPIGLVRSAVGFHVSPHVSPGLAPSLERAGDDGLAARANGNLLVERQAQGNGPAQRAWGMRRAGPADATQAPLK
jgi:hypothetical protein